MQRLLASLCLIVSLAGCASQSSGPDVATVCGDDRPQVCTMEYNPVCALVDSGERKTYASGCNACADVVVVGHDGGACPEE